MLCPTCQIKTNLFSVRRDNLKYEAFYSCPKCGKHCKQTLDEPPVPLCEVQHLPVVVDVREIADQMHIMYRCSKCFLTHHEIEYKHVKGDGHKCRWEFLGTEFIDGKQSHSINHIYRCFLCGTVHEAARDTNGIGLSGRVEIDDPRVEKTLLYNQSAWERLIPKDMQDPSRGKLPVKPILPREVEL